MQFAEQNDGVEQPGLQIKGFQERTEGGNFSASGELTSVCNSTIGLEPLKGRAMVIRDEPKSSQTQFKDIPTVPNMTQLVRLIP